MEKHPKRHKYHRLRKLYNDEIKNFKTNPLKADTDGDGKKDGYEVRRGMNPLKK
jgi:hypothetical protein